MPFFVFPRNEFAFKSQSVHVSKARLHLEQISQQVLLIQLHGLFLARQFHPAVQQFALSGADLGKWRSGHLA